MKRRTMWIIILTGAVGVAGLFFLARIFLFPGYAKRAKLQVGNTYFNVEVADTIALRAQGLSGHAPLAPNEGMLFKFSSAGNNGFWMKDMTFALDFVWIKDGKVAGVTERVQPPAKNTSLFALPIYYPPEPVEWVLEINEGLVANYGIKIGDNVEIR